MSKMPLTWEELVTTINTELDFLKLMIDTSPDFGEVFPLAKLISTVDIVSRYMEYDKDQLSYDELSMYLRLLSYEGITASAYVAQYLEIANNTTPKQSVYDSDVEASLSDANKSAKVIQSQIEVGFFPKSEGVKFIKSISVAEQKLKIAIEAGDKVIIALEHKGLQNELKIVMDWVKARQRETGY